MSDKYVHLNCHQFFTELLCRLHVLNETVEFHAHNHCTNHKELFVFLCHLFRSLTLLLDLKHVKRPLHRQRRNALKPHIVCGETGIRWKWWIYFRNLLWCPKYFRVYGTKKDRACKTLFSCWCLMIIQNECLFMKASVSNTKCLLLKAYTNRAFQSELSFKDQSCSRKEAWFRCGDH